MELAKLAGGALMADRASLSPVKLLEQHEGVGRVGFSGHVFLRRQRAGEITENKRDTLTGLYRATIVRDEFFERPCG
jgi:hypothetical protein